METKINYQEAYEDLRKNAISELKDFLALLDNKTYEFITEDELSNLTPSDFLKLPVIDIVSSFDNRLFSVYLVSISLRNNSIIIEGVEDDFCGEYEVRSYSLDDVPFKMLPTIFDSII